MIENLTRQEFEAVLTPENIRPLQLLYLALAAGPAIFALVILYLYFYSTPGGESNLMFVEFVSVLHFTGVLIAFPLTAWLYQQCFRENKIGALLRSSVPRTEAAPLHMLKVFRFAGLVRFIPLEYGISLGLMAVFAAVQGGIIQQQPIYWLNLLSTIIFIPYVLLNIPTAESLGKEFREKVLYGSN